MARCEGHLGEVQYDELGRDIQNRPQRLLERAGRRELALACEVDDKAFFSILDVDGDHGEGILANAGPRNTRLRGVTGTTGQTRVIPSPCGFTATAIGPKNSAKGHLTMAKPHLHVIQLLSDSNSHIEPLTAPGVRFSTVIVASPTQAVGWAGDVDSHLRILHDPGGFNRVQRLNMGLRHVLQVSPTRPLALAPTTDPRPHPHPSPSPHPHPSPVP